MKTHCANGHDLTVDGRRRKNGYLYCIACSRENNRKWRIANPERASECGRKWRTVNAERNRELVKKWQITNRERHLRNIHKWQTLNPDNERANRLKRNYAMNLTEYESLLKQQKGVCAICGNINKSGRRLAVDHCHATGKIRGLICHRCNVAIGQLGDSIERARQLGDYLEYHSQLR